MDKPEDCAICFEKLDEEYALECGHWLHVSCVQKHFKPECPICRTPLNIQVYGTPPSNNISMTGTVFGQDINLFLNPVLDYLMIGNVVESQYEQKHIYDFKNIDMDDSEDDSEDESEGDSEEEYKNSNQIREIYENEDDEDWRMKGFLHREEDEDYDEENPYGDEYSYDDY